MYGHIGFNFVEAFYNCGWHSFEQDSFFEHLFEPSFEWHNTILSVSLFSLEHFFEWLTHLSPLLSKATHLSTFLSKPTRLSTFLSTQKSRFALESTFLSGFTLLSAFLSAQKSAQGPAEPTSGPPHVLLLPASVAEVVEAGEIPGSQEHYES